MQPTPPPYPPVPPPYDPGRSAPPGATGPSGSGRSPWAVVALVVVVLALIAGALAIVLRSGDDEAGAEVHLEAADAAGTDPFTESIVVGPAVEFPGNVEAINEKVRTGLDADAPSGTLVATGTTPGLYGGTGDRKLCDPAKLVAFLDGAPAKARAWAAVFGIDASAIDDYVAKLAPVVLTSDTVVTNHGFRNGRANAFTAVLQAGTAVLVDSTGVPRVKCNCGNPLAPAPARNLRKLKTIGTAWAKFDPAQVVAVTPGDDSAELTVTDIGTGESTPLSVGSAGTWAAAVVSSGGTEFRTSPDGTTWAVAGRSEAAVSGLTWDGARWIAVAPSPGSGTRVLTSTDLKTWKDAATVPALLGAIAAGDGHLLAVGSTDEGPGPGGISYGTSGAAYQSDDASNWRQLEVGSFQDGSIRMTAVTHGPAGWLAVVDADFGNSANVHAQRIRELQTAKDADRIELASATEAVGVGSVSNEARSAVAADDAGYLVASEPWTVPEGVTPGDEITQSRLDTPLQVGPTAEQLTSVTGTPFADTPADALAHGPGGWLAVSRGDDAAVLGAPFVSSTRVFTSADGRAWKQSVQVEGDVRALAYGGSAPAAPASSTTTAPGKRIDLHGIDWKNRSYALPADYCSDATNVQLSDGHWEDADHFIAIDLESVQYADVTDDGVEDAVAVFTCTAIGGNAYPGYLTLVFQPGATAEELVGNPITGTSPDLTTGHIRTTDPVWADNDPRCCWSKETTTIWRFQGGNWVATEVDTHPTPGR